MELRSSKDTENVKALEASVVEKNKEDKDREVAADTGKNKNEVNEMAVGGMEGILRFGEALMDETQEENVSETLEEKNRMASKEVESSSKKTPRVTSAKTKTVEKPAKKLLKRKPVAGTSSVKDDADQDLTAAVNEEDEKAANASFGGNSVELKKVIDGSAEDSQPCAVDEIDAEPSLLGNVMDDVKVTEGSAEDQKVAETESSEKKSSKGLKEETKIVKTRRKRSRKGKKLKGTPPSQGVHKEGETMLHGSNEGIDLDMVVTDNKVGKKNAEASPGGNGKKFEKVIGDSVGAPALTKSAMRRLLKRLNRNVNKTRKKKKKDTNPGGLIFMCNAMTKPDCFRFGVMGVSEKNKDFVMGIKPGRKLFLYDYDLKLLYGIFVASSVGGLNLERKAFGGSYPAQVRFKVLRDCEPLPESIFRKAIKQNYDEKNKFKTELTPVQVFQLRKLFCPAEVPFTAQLTHAQPIPVDFDADRKRSGKDRSAVGSHRARTTHSHEGRGPLPHREPRDLYLTQREYQAYGVGRGQTSHHYPIPPGHSYCTVDGYHVASDSYHPDLDRDHLLRHVDIERYNHREPLYFDPLYLPRRDYYSHDHRREILIPHPQIPINPTLPTLAPESYARDPYYSYGCHPPVAERQSRAYPLSPGRNDALYARYATVDSLAEYYQAQRYPGLAHPALPPPSGYPCSGSYSYPYR